MRLKQFIFALTAMLMSFSLSVSAQTELLVSSDYNSSTEGYGTSKFSNYAGAYAYATANATNATIVIEKTTTLSGNTFDNNHKNYSKLAVVIKDGATMGNALSKWDMTYPVTVEPGGTLTCARPKSASVSNIHIKNTLTVGAEGATKKAVVDFLSDTYQDCDISIRYNGKVLVYNADFRVQDLDAQGILTIEDSKVEVDGAFASATFFKTTLTNTEMTVNGNLISGGLSDFAGGDSNQLGNVTINNSTLTIKEGTTKVASTVTATNSTIDVNELTVNTGKTLNLNEGSTLEAENITLNGTATVKVDGVAANVKDGVLITPKGNDFTGYTRGDAIWGEVWGNATESFVIKVLDANGNVMGTTSLNNIGGIIDGDVNVTWSLKFDADSNTDEYWTMEWTTAPTINNMPAKVELWVDGVRVSGGDVVLNAPDNLNKIYAAVTDANGKILSFHTDVQEAIKAAAAVTSVARTATAGTVEFLADVTVDKWIMFAEKMTVSDGSLITLNINGVTIDGNGKTLTVKSIESAGNGGYLFYDAQNLTVKDLTINIADGLVGGIGLQSGTISNVTFNGGQYAVLPGSNGVTIDGCTFNDTKGYAVYYENERPGIVVTGNTFNTADGAYAITMRGDEQFTDNTITKGRVNLANSAASTVSGNDFGTERFKVYNGATATIEDNTIDNLVFNDASVVNSTFANNTLSTEAQAVLDAAKFAVAKIGDVEYDTLAKAVAAAQAGDEIVLLDDVAEDATLPAGVKFNGNGKAVGNLTAGGEITFTGVTKAVSFDVENTNTTVNIVAGACLEITGTGRMVIGHGCTFNITGNIENAKTADVAALTPSLIMPGASFTGAGVTFNVTNAYIKAPSSYCSSSKSASGTFDFNFTNSIWESAGKLAFESQSTAATVNFDLVNSVLNTGSHLVFGVSRGEVVIDNSNVNVGTTRQIENQSTMTIKNGSVVNGAVATSSNAKNPGTLIVENATYAVTGEFSGSDLGTGTLIVKKGATVSAGSITKANIQIDATGMAAGDVINLTANLSNLEGSLTVVNNNLDASIVDGKIVLAVKPVAKIGDVEYETLAEAFGAATEGETITLLADATPVLKSQSAITKAAVIDLGGNTLTLTEDDLYFGTTTFKNGTIVVDPSVYANTAVFWMFANQTLTFDNVDIIATGLTGTYLIGINNGTGSSVNLLNGSSITIDNSEKAELSTVIADNGNGNSVIIKDSKIDVKNVDARLYLGGQNGSVTIENSDIVLNGVKEGFYLRAGQTLAINGTSKVDITLNADTKPRYGINMTDATATYTKAETATVNATVYAPATGSNSLAYTKEENGYVRVWGEGGGNAKESYELKLYSGETLIATTKLNNVGNIIDGDVYVTWNFYYPQSTDEYWTTTWEEGHPNSAAQPTEVELYIDGTLVATTAAKMSGADDVNPVVWRDLGGVAIADLLGEGTETSPYLISNKKELLWFQAKVDEQAADGSTQFAGKYFKLTADIDLAGENWNPIGSMSGDHGSFKGVFDGGDHTISNLKVEQAGNGIGLFARTAGNAVIKNLKLNNVSVKSTDNSNYAGAVVGNAYASTKIENVHVSGNVLVSGRGYIGGIAGHGYVVMDNVSVVATGDGQGNGKGLITSTFWCAGGILGYAGEGATNIMNANVENVVVTSAAGGLGAIVGMAEDNNGTQPISGSNLSAKDVEIKTYIGAYGDSYANYALGYLYGGNPTSKLTGELSVENVTLTTSNGVVPTPVDAVAKVNETIYFSLQKALDAAAAGTGDVTVEILSDVNLTDIDWNPVTVSAPGYPVVTVEGNNKTITGLNDMLFAGTWAGNSGLIIKNLTIANSTIVNDKDDAAGTVGVGAFIGFPQASETITLENCHLVNSSVEGGHWTGGLIGMAGGYNGNDGPVFMNLTITGCSVTGSTITGKGSVGGVIGHGSCAAWTNVVIENTTVSGNAITSTGSSNVKAGAVMGTIGAAGQSTTANGETKTGGATVSATVADNTVKSNGTTITTIYGRQGTETGMLYLNGGTYDNNPIEENVDYAKPADGYKIEQNTGGTYGVVVDPAYGKVAKIGDTYYATIAEAIEAAQQDDIVTILAGDYTQNINVNKAITVVGETDAEGKNLVNITGKLNITADGATVKNLNVNNGSSTGGYINANNVTVEGCQVVGGNGFRNCYTKGNVTFRNSVITGSTYGIHFDGSDGGNIVIENCTITGWTSFASTITNVALTGTKFEEGNYNYVRFYQDAQITNCTFNEKMGVDIAVNNADVTVENSTVEGGKSVETLFNGADMANSNITVDGVKLVRIAKIGNNYYATLAEAIAAIGAGDVVIELLDNATFDYNARDAYGTAETTSVTINGNGKTLTLNQKDSDWASIGLAAGKLVLNDMTIEKTGYGDTSGAWNTHAIIFSCPVEMTDVTVNNGIAVQAGATLNNVTINEANGYYGLWVNGNGQSVTVNGGAINATNGGRGIKVADQYIDAPAQVTLNVTDTEFNTANKAAVLVTSTAGAKITASNVDITNVAQDNVNFVWVDEDRAANYGAVEVTGATVAQESVEQFPIVVKNGDKIVAYFKNLDDDAIEAVENGATITVIKDFAIDKMVTVAAGKELTIDLNGKTITGTDNTSKNFSIIDNRGNLTIKDSSAEKSGKITLTATIDSDWGRYSAVIANNPGGKLTIDGGTLEHLGGTDMAYGIDNLTNGKGTYAETVINDGTIKSTYRGIRQFLNGIEAQNILTINGGTVEGANKSVWMQDPNKNANTGTLIVGENAKLVGDAYLSVTAGSTEWPVEVSIAAAALQGESKVMTGNVPAGYELAVVDGTYGVYTGAAKIGTVYYATIAEAINAAQAGETVVILAGEHAEGTIKLPATLKNVTFKGVEGAVLKDMTIMAHDGNTINYEGLTFDGIVFENSRIAITGWRNGDVAVKDFTVKNCTFKNLNDTSNSAPLHFNMDADEAVNGLTFTNNVIDGATGGSKSGIYAQVTGKTVFSNNVINNVAFRPYVVQLTTNDGVADEFVVTGNTFSGSAAGRAQGLGNSAEGTDAVKLVVSNNIFKDITDAQQICYWNFNEATTEAVLEKNYYDINIIEKANRFYFNSAAQDASDLVAMGIFPYYTELNADGTINEESLTVVPVAVTANTGYATVTEAIKAAADGATVEILAGEHDEVIAPWAGDTQHTSEKSITIVGSKNFGTTLTAGMYLGYDDSQCRDHNIVVKGIAFKGKGLKVACQQNVTIEGNKFADITEGQAIAVIGKNINSVVKNNVIENVAAAQGIELRNTLTATVEGNTISGTAHNSLQITSQVGATNSSVTVKDNTMSNWGTAGEGRAMRINNIVTADINGNVMSHTGAPEEFVKVTGSTTLNAAANYWNGVSPLTAGMFTGVEGDPIAALQSYYTDSAKSNLVTFTTTESAAIINGSYYETLAAAVTAVKDGETITLLKTCSENVTINQVKTKSFTIDGNNNTYTGTITVVGDGTTNNTPTETLTFRNINFVTAAATYAITAKKGSYARNITVEDCSFKGENSYGIRVRNGYNYTLKNVTVDGFYSFFNATESLSGLTVENVTVTNTGSAFNFSYATGIASLKNVNIDVTGNGIWFQNRNASTVTLENCSIKAATPINITEAVTNTNNFVFNGTNNFTATNGENWLVINDNAEFNATFNVTVNDANLDIAKTSGLAAYAKNSERSYGSNKFLNVTSAMADGDVVTLVADVALTTANYVTITDNYATLCAVKEQNVTIDLNGKVITVNASAADVAGAESGMLFAVFAVDTNGNLTITDSSNGAGAVNVVANDAPVYCLAGVYGNGGKLTIENGSYTADMLSNCLIYAQHENCVTVNNGNYHLGNVGTGANGSPWIFNTYGKNVTGATVNGGTFNTDINHTFWANEVFVPETLALRNNGDGTWTVVPAVAYAVEKANSTGSSDRNIGYATVAEAVEGVRNGGTVTLLKDIEFAESFVINNEKTIIFDGDGHKLTQADGYTDKQNGLLILGATSSNDGDAKKRNYTIKNVVFDGITGWSAIRSQGVTLTVDSCTFQNCQQTNGQAMIRLDYTEADIKNSVFEDNSALMAITHNFNADDSQTKLNVEECVFQDNTFNKTAGIYYVCGGGCTISNSEFIKNTVNCNTNGAVIYLGFQENCKVTGNLFKENVVADASTSTRVAGAIFFGYDAEISGNVFENNTASNANGDVLGQVCTSTYYDCAIDLGDNYWGGEAPVYGNDYTIQHQTGDATFALDSYYTAYTLDENGNVVLSDLVELVQIAMVGKLSYTTLQAAVDAADNATVILLNSVEGAGVVINNNVTIDFAGYTYTVNKAVGSAGTETLGFQILKDNNVTLKNGVLNSTPVVEGKEVKMLIQNYANLTLEDIDLVDNTDHILYVLSNNSGTTAITGETNITTDAVAFDVYDYTSGGYAVPTVNINTTGVISGNIEVSESIQDNLNIYNGTYDLDVNKWCADGFTAAPNTDGTYSVVTGARFIDGQFTAYTNPDDMEVDYIRYERTFPKAWNAFYVPFEVPVSQLADQGFEVAYINGVRRKDADHNGVLDNEFSMEVIYIHGGNADGSTKTLKANYPYFVKYNGNEGNEKNLVIELEEALLHAAKNATYDCTTFTEKFEITGNASQLYINSTTDAAVYGVTAKGEWTNITAGATLKTFRFYMTVTSRDGNAPVYTPASMSIVVRGEELPDGTTLIYDIEAETGDEFIFDLTGRRVLDTDKAGIYIKNGKKVLVK